jgi:hypothetical protein
VNDNLRRRKAAFLLRQRAADALDQASELDGLPAMRLLLTDLRRIAAAAGCDAEKLAYAALALYPGHDDTTTEADDDLAGSADTAEGTE